MHHAIPRSLTLAALMLLGGCGGGASFDDRSEAVVSGRIVDAQGRPVAGAVVTAAGVQAAEPSAADGSFRVDMPFALSNPSLLVTVSQQGEHLVQTAAVERNGRSVVLRDSLAFAPVLNPDRLEISAPTPGAVVNPDADCVGAVVVAGLALRETLVPNNDIVVCIDASGSTADPANGVNGATIFERQIQAARRLLQRMETGTVRVSVVRFATQSVLWLPPTEYLPAALQSLKDLAAQGPEERGTAAAGSDFAQALAQAQQLLRSQPWTMPDPTDPDHAPALSVAAIRRVLFFTDGVPTLPVAPGLTQEAGDISATLEAAQLLAADGLRVHGFAVGPRSETDRLTTLPTVAAITGGSYRAINSKANIDGEMDQVLLAPVSGVLVENLRTGESATAVPGPDGHFQVEIAVDLGENTLRVSTLSGTRSTSTSVSVLGVLPGPSGQADALYPQTVAQRGFLRPDGTALSTRDATMLAHELGLPETSSAVESSAGLWSVAGNGLVSISGEVVYREAGYKSDVGFLVVDPADLQASAQRALAAATPANLLYNVGEVDHGVVEPSARSLSATVPAGSWLVFFLVPNSTLASAQEGKASVLWSSPALNPGRYDQALFYFLPAGRRAQGQASLMVSFEDIALTKGSDRDFTDTVFVLQAALPSEPRCVSVLDN